MGASTDSLQFLLFVLHCLRCVAQYGFTSNINEDLIQDIADGVVSSGLDAFGYRLVAIDDGWAAPRDPTTNEITADPALFPHGMANLSAYVTAKNLTFGIYTDRGNLTCLVSGRGYSVRLLGGSLADSPCVAFTEAPRQLRLRVH